MEWPPDYAGELDRRLKLEHRLTADATCWPVRFSNTRRARPTSSQTACGYTSPGTPTSATRQLPCVLFPRQREFIEWLHSRFTTKTSAPVEKSRDSGATWMSCAFAVWVWLFHPGSTVGFGSRKEILVDRAGDLQSIFEKTRSIVRNLPHYLKPKRLQGAHAFELHAAAEPGERRHHHR